MSHLIHYILHHTWASILSGILAGAIIAFLIIFRRAMVRTFRRLIHVVRPSSIPAWKVIMKVRRPGMSRPRYLSIQTLGALTGRTDLLKLAKEMKDSCEVNGSYCTTVMSPVFYLNAVSNYHQSDIWDRMKKSLEMFPYPATKGFRASEGEWSGGYGRGTYVVAPNAMPTPFVKEDHRYANAIINAMKDAGYTPGIKKYKIDKSTPLY